MNGKHRLWFFLWTKLILPGTRLFHADNQKGFFPHTLLQNLLGTGDQTYIGWLSGAIIVEALVVLSSLAFFYFLWVDKIYRVFLEVFVILSFNTGLLTFITIFTNNCLGRLFCVRAIFGIAQTTIFFTSFLRNQLLVRPLAGDLVNMWTMRTIYIVLLLWTIP